MSIGIIPDRHAELPSMTNRVFGFAMATISGGISLAAFVFWDRFLPWGWGVSGVCAVVSIMWPMFFLPFNRLWRQVANWIARGNNILILGCVYTVLFIPTALLFRLIGRDILRRRKRKSDTSFFSEVTRQTTKETLSDLY